MSIKGSSYGNFRRALETGNLTLIRAAAAELPAINLEDALRVAILVCEHEPEHGERAELGLELLELRPAVRGIDVGLGLDRRAGEVREFASEAVDGVFGVVALPDDFEQHLSDGHRLVLISGAAAHFRRP